MYECWTLNKRTGAAVQGLTCIGHVVELARTRYETIEVWCEMLFELCIAVIDLYDLFGAVNNCPSGCSALTNRHGAVQGCGVGAGDPKATHEAVREGERQHTTVDGVAAEGHTATEGWRRAWSRGDLYDIGMVHKKHGQKLGASVVLYHADISDVREIRTKTDALK